MKGLQGKTAIVTGGSSGIGQAIAIRLGQEGVNVAVNYVGPPEGAVATRDAIEGGVERCITKSARPAPRRCSPRPTCPTNTWNRCGRRSSNSSAPSTSW